VLKDKIKFDIDRLVDVRINLSKKKVSINLIRFIITIILIIINLN
jgi:hypothetical protein